MLFDRIRLSRFSNTKKDAVSHAAKVILPTIKLLDEDSSEALWVSATFKISLNVSLDLVTFPLDAALFV